ncbi:MAG: LPS assembly lipoprotein LptE [Planctomycetota bacterium]
MMRIIKAATPMILLCVGPMIFLGCANNPADGYSFSSGYPEDVRTVAVPIWNVGKNVYRREIEFRLTEALVKRIELDTPYKVAAKTDADTLLTGTVDNISQRVLSTNPDTGLPREMEMTITVSFEWTDLRSGEIRADRSNVRVSGTYVPHEPLSEDFFTGSEDVINRLARRIVEQMESDW